MDKKEFLSILKDVIETEEELSEGVVLDELDEWDSLAAMAVMAFFNKTFSVKLLPAEIKNMSTVADLLNKAGIK